MVNILKNSRLNAAFTTDPSVALWTYIKSIWGTTTGYSPPASATVKFDTKFGEQKGFFYFVIIENMPETIKPLQIGAATFMYDAVKRLQIFCIGPTAKDKKWKMERHIESLINADLKGMQTTYGINSVRISQFTELPGEVESEQKNESPTKEFQVARSYALVSMTFEQFQTV